MRHARTGKQLQKTRHGSGGLVEALESRHLLAAAFLPAAVSAHFFGKIDQNLWNLAQGQNGKGVEGIVQTGMWRTDALGRRLEIEECPAAAWTGDEFGLRNPRAGALQDIVI